MSQLGTVYATKRRRRNGKSLKPPPKDGVTKSNPSKRHRERLNAELDLLASLLPFEQNILSKLDRLSILRLSVSYLRTKSYFQVVMHKDKEENGLMPHIHSHDAYRTRELGAFEHGLLDGDMFLQALNGFLMILTCEGEVFFATHSIESYLGFHQSDIVHQSVYELVHSEDREELQRQLLWNSFLPADMSSMQLADALAPDKTAFLERSFTVRFRCLLDNTSGFLRLDIRGRIKILHGQNRKTEEPPLALFAYCTPFGPPSLLEIPHKENMFKSKHKLDLSLVSMDQRGKMILGFSDSEFINLGGYDLVHYDDLAYVASAHQELLKTGASGMIAYRYQKKDGEWQWLQTSSRLVYKNSKPDFVICTHRQLMDEEGRDLLGKRTMDFKVSYLDTGLASTYFSEADQLVVAPSGSPNSLPPPVTPTRPNRRYKTQLRDFLSTCRSKRKMQQTSPLGQVTSPAPVVEYIPDPAVAVAAAYSNLNPMYTTSPYAAAADNLYMSPSVHSTNFYPVTENIFHQYRLQGVSGYYPDYHHHTAPPASYVTNGFLSYDGYTIAPKEDKWQESSKYYSGYSSGYGSPTSTPQISLKTPKSSPQVMEVVSCSSDGPSPVNPASSNPANSSTTNGVTPKVEMASHDPYERQTVLMWGTSGSRDTTPRSPQDASPTTAVANGIYSDGGQLVNGTGSSGKDGKIPTPESYHLHQHPAGDEAAMYAHHRIAADGSHIQSPHSHSAEALLHVASNQSSVNHLSHPHATSHQHHHHHSAAATAATGHQQHQHHHHMQQQSVVGAGSNGSEVWSPASYSQYSQYFTYHHHHHHHSATQHASTQSSSSNNNNTNNSNPSHHYPLRSNNSHTSDYTDVHHQPHPVHHHHPPLRHPDSNNSTNTTSTVTINNNNSSSSISNNNNNSSNNNNSNTTTSTTSQSSLHPSSSQQHHHQPHHPHPLHPHHPRHAAAAAAVVAAAVATASGGTISQISPLTQLSHTHHPVRSPINRTGVLCCPSLR